jgi:hypothetical protein
VKKILKHLGLWDVKRKPTPRANGSPSEAFIIYDELSSPGMDDYLTPLEAGLSDGNLPLKKSSPGQTGELCPNLPKCSIPRQKINVDNNARFRYLDGYCLR